jgi:lipoprotein-anchoring transpeptidase ErfK/SrfK
MAWTFKITPGTLLNLNSIQVGQGYSGHGEGLNNPAMCSVHNVGPLPTGKYKIGQPRSDNQVGVFAMPLTPDPSNEMFGRSAFFLHGDNASMNHTASDGCIILNRPLRNDIANSGDDELIVIE